MSTVNGLCQDAGASGFAYAARPTEEESLSQLASTDGILKGGGDMLLPHHALKGRRAVLSR